jgi:uncharacterized membrane protein
MSIRQIKPEKFFLVVAIIAGVLLTFITPIGAGFDEDTIVARIWQISGLHFIPNQQGGQPPSFPSVFYQLSYRQNPLVEPVEWNYFQDNWNAKIDSNTMLEYYTHAIYSPVLYLPQAVIMGIFGRLLKIPVIPIYYLLRLSCLALYALTAYYAIKIIPYGKWLLALLALSPMALYQTATVTPDAISDGASFLFIAWVLNQAYQSERPIKNREIITFLALTAMLFCLKINSSPLVLIFFLLPAHRFESKRKYWLTLGGVVVLFILLEAGWNAIATSQMDVLSSNPAVQPFNQILYILQHPFAYLQMQAVDLSAKFVSYYKDWVGVFGNYYWKAPTAMYWVYGLLTLFIMLLDPPKPLSIRSRSLMVVTFFLGFFLTVTILYITKMPVGGSSLGTNFQGRYLIPLAPLLLLGITPCISLPKLQTWLKPVLFGGLGITLFLYLGAAFLSYHVACGTQYYTAGYCSHPIYKNWSPNTQFSDPVVKGVEWQQSFEADCNKMEAVSLWVDSPRKETGSTTFTIQTAKTKELLLKTTIANNQMPQKNWLTLPFQRLETSRGLDYLITVTSTDANPADGIRMAVSTRKEYWRGALSISGKSVDHDLLFNYSCAIGIAVPSQPQP